MVTELAILNTAKTPPFMIEDDTEVAENLRLKYRYLDLRRDVMQKRLRLRHSITRAMRFMYAGRRLPSGSMALFSQGCDFE